jgi:ATP phosphoribosyltransferase regulatory subunit
MNNKKYLLPVGFYDLLEDEAKINQTTIDLLLDSFYAKNYQLIKTPLVEFEESFKNFSQKIDDQSFRTIDNFSGKTLILRSDITPQIARILATKLQNYSIPIRLCYVGDVLRVKNENLYADRQLTQVGIELIGEDSCSSDTEIIELTILALERIKLSNLMINFCLPQFLDILLTDLNIDDIANLKNAITNKNISAIYDLAKKHCDDLIIITLENQNFDKINSALSRLPLKTTTKNQIIKWQKTIDDIKLNYQKINQKINFSIDIFGDQEFCYHHQIGFTIFADGCKYPIARGGRYLVNNLISAVGSTIYINNLRQILK